MGAADRRSVWTRRHATAVEPARPSPFVVTCLDALTLQQAESDTLGPSRRLALDLACGSGRHALLMAERGYRVEAVDYALPALVALRAEAAERTLAVHCLAADVTAWPLPHARYELVVVVNFLERGLFPALRDAIRPGGALLFETFLEGQERYGHPRNPAYLLRSGELARALSGWKILASHEGPTTRGREPVMLAGVLARKPS